MVCVLSVAARGARTTASVLAVAVFSAAVSVCVRFVVRKRQQQVQADWPTPAVLFNLRAASRLAKRWRVVVFGLRAVTQGLAPGPLANRALRLR